MIRKIPIKISRPSTLDNKITATSRVTVTSRGVSCTNCDKQSTVITTRVNHQLCADCAKAFDLAKIYYKNILYAHNVPAGVVNLLD